MAALLDEELEVLESIYANERSVTRRGAGEAAVVILCAPASDGADVFVTVVLELVLTLSCPPSFAVKDSFGLDARDLSQVEAALLATVEASAEGEAIGFQLIECVKEQLETLNLVASCQVAIYVTETPHACTALNSRVLRGDC
jgi:hypothetical protein